MTRPLDDDEIRFLALDLFKNPGERDLQKKIGASEIGNPCDYCLGNRLLNTPKASSKYWLGAKIGTAIHREAEFEAAKHLVTPERPEFQVLQGAKIEEKILLGTIDGYGDIHSRVDLALTTHPNLIDWKTSTPAKVKKYKLDGVPMQYVYQQNLYGWGLNKAGIRIERLDLVFINRDGLTDDDFWVWSMPYDESLALKAWDRLELIWKYLEAGHDVETLKSHPDCYYCSVVLHRM